MPRIPEHGVKKYDFIWLTTYVRAGNGGGGNEPINAADNRWPDGHLLIYDKNCFNQKIEQNNKPALFSGGNRFN